MNSWLAEAGNLAASGTPFVLATVWNKSGYSRDDLGARLLISKHSVFGSLNSDKRQETILNSAKVILTSHHPLTIEHYPLGEILGSENGHYEVLFTYFDACKVPDWLNQACRLQQQEKRFVLYQRILGTDTGSACTDFGIITDDHPLSDPVSKSALGMLDALKPPMYSELITGQTTKCLLQVIGEPVITIGVLGSSPVAVCLVEQLLLLPVSVRWLTEDRNQRVNERLLKVPLCDESLSALPSRTRLVIATGNHETDLHYCKLGLQSAGLSYVGCIGSARKAEIIRSYLTQQGLTRHLVDNLRIPIGLPAIKGKHPQLVAASIVAQLLSFQEEQS